MSRKSNEEIRKTLEWEWVRMADCASLGYERGRSSEAGDQSRPIERPERFCDAGRLDNPVSNGRGEGRNGDNGRHVGKQSNAAIKIARTGPTNGFWGSADWLFCRDGKWRPVEPGTFPLVNGAPARVGRLRGYGNAINAEVAKTFIEAVMEAGA